MAITVHVQNFQSITDATLVVDGFTAITGPNNTGKSAFFRAVQGLFRNTKGTWFVRHGATHCTVKITFADGVSVTWEKGKKGINRYRINDDDWLEKVSHGVPETVAEVLKVHAVTIGSTTCWPQIGEQFSGQVFLLDKPGSVLAEAVSDVERVGRLNKALKIAESDRRKARATLKVRRRDEETAQNQLVQFHGLDDVSKGIDGLDEMCGHATRTRNALLELVRLKESLERERAVIQQLDGVDSITPPSEDLFTEAREALREYHTLLKLDEDLTSARAEASLLQKACDAFDGVDFWEELEELTGKTIRSLAVLQGLRGDLQARAQGVQSVEQEITVATGELQGAEEELRAVLSEMPECPVCGADIDGQEGLQHVH